MTVRRTLADAARRTLVNLARGVIKKTDDTKMLQQVDLELLADEKKTDVERFQQYGMTAVVKPPSQSQSSQGSQGGGGGGQSGQGGGQGQQQEAAEQIVLFLGSERTHAVVIAIDDRRYRLGSLADGDVAQYDFQGHQFHMNADGTVLSVPKSKKYLFQVMKSDDLPKPQSGKGRHAQQYKVNDQNGNDQNAQNALATHQIDQNSETTTHPLLVVVQVVSEGSVDSSITLNTNDIIATAERNITETAGATFLAKAPTVVAEGTVKLGATTDSGSDVVLPVALLGAVDSNGDEIVLPISVNTFGK